MIPLPNQNFGMQPGTLASEHVVIADWAELNILFDPDMDTFSQAEMVDVIKESHWTLGEGDDQSKSDKANELVTEVFGELRRRVELEGANSAYAVTASNRLVRMQAWTNRIAQAFMALCAARFYYDELDVSPFNNDNLRGRLFEELVACAISWPQWTVRHAGWSQNNSITIETLRDQIAGNLEESPNDLTEYVGKTHKDLGLDHYSWRPFPDSWSARPLILFQCASGVNWRTKRGTPDREIWEKVIRFSNPPMTAITIPFVLRKAAVKLNASMQKGLVLDRVRLLGAPLTVPPPLAAELQAFGAAAVPCLPQ